MHYDETTVVKNIKITQTNALDMDCRYPVIEWISNTMFAFYIIIDTRCCRSTSDTVCPAAPHSQHLITALDNVRSDQDSSWTHTATPGHGGHRDKVCRCNIEESPPAPVPRSIHYRCHRNCVSWSQYFHLHNRHQVEVAMDAAVWTPHCTVLHHL